MFAFSSRAPRIISFYRDGRYSILNSRERVLKAIWTESSVCNLALLETEFPVQRSCQLDKEGPMIFLHHTRMRSLRISTPSRRQPLAAFIATHSRISP
jgi:hypothetical protein